ncbi:MAG: hypothetical protein NUV60_00810 [Patescibacteria group bacterium]|nr:hypothetical protein [Patescibacteria group bacterium]
MNTKIVWVVVALVVVGVVAYVFVPKIVPQDTQGATQNSPLVVQGAVTGVDAEKLQITMQAATTSPLKVVTITSATKIEKIISQKDASGTIEKQAVAEVNLSDVQKEDQVTVVYQSEKDGVLSGVSQVTFTVEGNVEDYFASQTENQPPYIKGQVVAVDIAGKTLQYKPYFFSTLATTTTSATIPDGIAVYQVDDSARAAITYARMAITLADIKPGQIISIVADPVALETGEIIPQMFIISMK